jgi:hypothetical protein
LGYNNNVNNTRSEKNLNFHEKHKNLEYET